VLRVCHGRRTEDTVADFVTAPQRAAAVARLQALELADLDGVTALPGAGKLLEDIPRGRWAAVTSGERELMTARLAAAHLSIPDTMVCAEDVAVGKPSPEGYVKAAAALKFDAHRCVVIEDAPAGIAAGLAAGAHVLAVTTTHDARQVSDAAVVIPDLSSVRVEFTGNELVLMV
jgi:sugar-phosphatase